MPILLVHRASERIRAYSIGRVLPVAIRDQMMRGRMIVDRAVERRFITPELPLVVIGAGAAGVTAALRATIDHKVPVYLVDKSDQPFTRQHGCATRWIDPVQYDWPVAHWSCGRYDWIDPAMPLRFHQGFATDIARRWKDILDAADTEGRLAFYPDSRVEWPPEENGDYWRTRILSIDDNRLRVVVDAGMILYAGGPGAENTTIGTFAGFRFWDTDPYLQENLGFLPGSRPHVLISGAGDGALQDFLRITCDPSKIRSAADLYTAIADEVLPAHLRRIADAEDQAQRALIWGATKQHDHPTLSTLHRNYEDVLQVMQRDSNRWQRIVNATRTVLRLPLPRVLLVHPCDHFGRCYALNHFLVLLLADVIKTLDAAARPVRSHLTVSTVTSLESTHRCANTPADCHGIEHQVLAQYSTCHVTHAVPTLLGAFDAIIVRHGIIPDTTPQNAVYLPRQLLPYHVSA